MQMEADCTGKAYDLLPGHNKLGVFREKLCCGPLSECIPYLYCIVRAHIRLITPPRSLSRSSNSFLYSTMSILRRPLNTQALRCFSSSSTAYHQPGPSQPSRAHENLESTSNHATRDRNDPTTHFGFKDIPESLKETLGMSSLSQPVISCKY